MDVHTASRPPVGRPARPGTMNRLAVALSRLELFWVTNKFKRGLKRVKETRSRSAHQIHGPNFSIISSPVESLLVDVGNSFGFVSKLAKRPLLTGREKFLAMFCQP